MRRSLLLYLFVFTALIVVFQYVTSRKMLEAKDREIEELREDLGRAQMNNDSLASPADSELFLFRSNDQAMAYFEDRGIEASEVELRIQDEIIGRNKAADDNDLVPYKGMEGEMRINSIRVLNHKWILADFTDGSHWGELFLTYYIDEENKLSLETENSLLYPKN